MTTGSIREYISVCGDSPLPPKIYSMGFIPSENHPRMDGVYRDHSVIHYVLSGEGRYEGFPVKKGQGFYVQAGITEEHHADKVRPWSYFWVELDVPEEEKLLAFLSTDESMIFSYDFGDELQKIIAEALSTTRVAVSQLSAQNTLLRILRLHDSRDSAIGNLARCHFDNLCRYMEGHMDRPLRLSEVASYEHIDVQYMYNLFIRFSGVSPKKYLSDLRLRRACHLLRNTEFSIGEVGQSCGYPDGLQFSKFYATAMGRSPKAYRANLSENSDATIADFPSYEELSGKRRGKK